MNDTMSASEKTACLHAVGERRMGIVSCAHDIIRPYINLARFLIEALDRRYLVELYDVQDLEHPIVTSEHSAESGGSSVGYEAVDGSLGKRGETSGSSESLKAEDSPLEKRISGDGSNHLLMKAETDGSQPVGDGSEFMSEIVSSSVLSSLDYLCAQGDAAKRRHCVYYIKDAAGAICGMLYICERQDESVTVSEVYSQFMRTEETENEQRTEKEINIGLEIEALTRERVQAAWDRAAAGKEKLTKQDKVDFMRDLFEQGMLRVRGIAEIVSEVSGISQASFYRYMGEVID